MKNLKMRKEHQLGLGGVPIGTAFENISDEQALGIFEKAWELGIRYYDTSPWYGLTKSERRFGEFLNKKNKSEFLFSTKVGRLFHEVEKNKVPPTMWQNPLSFDYKHDYSTDATKCSIEESLKRTGRIITSKPCHSQKEICFLLRYCIYCKLLINDITNLLCLRKLAILV